LPNHFFYMKPNDQSQANEEMICAMTANQKVELKVLGMACGGCSAAVEKALRNLEGVASARVDLAKKTAYVDYDAEKLALEDLKKAVSNAGYKIG